MAYKLFKGEFYIFYPDLPHNGPEPDGDTLKFKPDNPLLLNGLKVNGGRGPSFNSRSMINVRFEGIDALETHFEGTHQNILWAEKARQGMLDKVGFGQVIFWDDGSNKVKSVEHNPVRGFLLARNLDPFGRVVAFVFAGEHPFIDGSDVWFDTELLEKSINTQLLEEGLVYPAFYSTLPVDLKNALAIISRQARNDSLGIWENDSANTKTWAEVAGLEMTESLVMWPKLFRRLVSYFATGFSDLSQFENWMRADKINRDDRLLLPSGELGNMHDIFDIDTQENRIRLNTRPEDVVIIPDDVATTTTQNEPLEPIYGPVRIIGALVNPVTLRDVGENVTIMNISPDQVDLSGWTVSDRSGSRVVLGGIIEAGQAKTIPLTTKVRLANSGDTIVVFDQDDQIIHQVSYNAREGQKEGRTIIF